MRVSRLVPLAVLVGITASACASADALPTLPERFSHPTVKTLESVQHPSVESTTFQVGRIYDARAGDQGQSMSSAWDVDWSAHYGGCDGIGPAGEQCQLDVRTPANDYFPTAMTPKENPFYVALPIDDTAPGFSSALPWTSTDGSSVLKNRWVRVQGVQGTCYGQLQDDGPAEHHDESYVLKGTTPFQPGPAIALSPALSACVGSSINATVSWNFVESPPAGPWTKVVTTTAASLRP